MLLAKICFFSFILLFSTQEFARATCKDWFEKGNIHPGDQDCSIKCSTLKTSLDTFTCPDESDAFRHFVWAGLLTDKLGAERAKLYLDAHEDNPNQPLEEKAMDLANNRDGVLTALSLRKAGKSGVKNLEMEALSKLKQGKLIVLKPGLTIPTEPK